MKVVEKSDTGRYPNIGEVFKFNDEYFIRISGEGRNVFNLSYNYIEDLSFSSKCSKYQIIEGAFIAGENK
jgi:hypothetical protein